MTLATVSNAAFRRCSLLRCVAQAPRLVDSSKFSRFADLIIKNLNQEGDDKHVLTEPRLQPTEKRYSRTLDIYTQLQKPGITDDPSEKRSSTLEHQSKSLLLVSSSILNKLQIVQNKNHDQHNDQVTS
jgi:hypothetical protein